MFEMFYTFGGIYIYKISLTVLVRLMRFDACLLHLRKEVEKCWYASLHAGVIVRNSLTPGAFVPLGTVHPPLPALSPS